MLYSTRHNNHKETNMNASKNDKIIEKIAKEHLYVEPLQTRNSDSLDFYDCAIWKIREALEAAYQAGIAAAQNANQQ